MKKFLLLIALFLGVSVLYSQPQKISYQAVIRDANGNVLQNQDVTLQLDILQGTSAGNVVYSETHDVTTNQYGMVNVLIGDGSPLQGDFSSIDWSNGPYFLRTSVDIGNGMEELGTQRLVSVPYSLYSESASYADSVSAVGNSGEIQFNNNGVLDASPNLYWDVTKERLGIGTNTPQGRLVIQQDPLAPDSLPLFEVKDKDGEPVFVVYRDSVHIYLPIDSSKAIGSLGKFAVSGRVTTKGVTKPYLYVTPDSTRIYFEKDNNKAVGSLGGFAVSGRVSTKGLGVPYLYISPDCTRIYFDKDSAKAVGSLGGFAVSGRVSTKGVGDPYLYVSPDSSRIYFDENNNKAVGSLGGFAVSGRVSTKATGVNDYFSISSKESVDTINPSVSRVCWYPKKEAFLAGRVLVESPDSVGTNSFATGFESKAIGNYSHALGYKAIARGDYSVAIGDSSIVIGDNSFALGEKAKVNSYRSVAIGYGSIVFENYSTAIGCGTQSNGWFSTSIGYHTETSNKGAIALGYFAKAIGNYSVGIGKYVQANGETSVAIGDHARAEGLKSFALGTYTTAKSYSSTVIGTYNDTSFVTSSNSWIDTDPIFVIGNGTWSGSHNAIVVLKNGNVGINTNTPDKLLTVNGDARVTGDIYYGSIGSTTTYNKPDFVFKPDYEKDFGIDYIERFIKKHGHLPWVTAAKDEKNGINMTRMSFQTLEAVENLQLQIIDLNKKLESKDSEIDMLRKENKELRKRIERIEKILKNKK